MIDWIRGPEFGVSRKLSLVEKDKGYSRVGNDWVSHVRKHPPDVAHSAAELFRSAGAVYYVSLARVETPDKRANARAWVICILLLLECTNISLTSNMINWDAGFFQCPEYSLEAVNSCEILPLTRSLLDVRYRERRHRQAQHQSTAHIFFLPTEKSHSCEVDAVDEGLLRLHDISGYQSALFPWNSWALQQRPDLASMK
jgi:hypothetical protein